MAEERVVGLKGESIPARVLRQDKALKVFRLGLKRSDKNEA